MAPNGEEAVCTISNITTFNSYATVAPPVELRTAPAVSLLLHQ
jgi:hypothetical protein